MSIKVIITGDHPIVVNGLNNVLSRTRHIQVTGIYHSITELLKNIAQTNADVLILDKQLQKSNILSTVHTLVKYNPSLQILAFSSNDSIYHVKNMLAAGCKGYLLKDADDDLLIKAIETVFQDKQFLSPALENALLEEAAHSKRDLTRKASLTRREKEVLNLIVQEHTNPEIAAKLFLSPSTVESHRTSILHKLGAKNTAGIVRLAFETGLVLLPA